MKYYVILLLLTLFLTSATAQEEAFVIDDFENGVPLSYDEYGNALGFVPWGDTFENVMLSATQLIPYSAMAVPGTEEEANTVLGITYDIAAGGWGGFTSIVNDGQNWTAQDWSAYNAIGFWLYGNNTGNQIQIDIFDNRNPSMNGDSAERFYYRIDDNYSGWQKFAIPFALFQRRTDFQPNGAPDDGLSLDEVSGYAFGFPVGTGMQTGYLDDVELTTLEDDTQVIISGAEEVSTGEEPEAVITWDSRNWELVWEDNFDGEAGEPINDENWTCETGGHGWGNQEWEYYTNRIENVSLDGNGSLAIVAREENPNNNSCWYGTCTHTSARCITKDKVEFTYGRVEARLKVPFGQGIWPAFWMLGANFQAVGWPNSGEIDIMENIGKEPTNLYGTVHGPGYSGANGIGGSITLPEALSDDFHIFAIDWDPASIRWYIDGELFNTLLLDDLNGREWVFDHDFFLLLNVAVGGLWPGYPDATTVFPQTMLVDYVRVYSLAKEE